MSLLEDIASLGVDTGKALTQFMGNQALYEKMLKKLPDVADKHPVASCIAAGEIETASDNAHALKGVTGNLVLTPLYENYCKIMDAFRGGRNDEAAALVRETDVLLEAFITCISKYID